MANDLPLSPYKSSKPEFIHTLLLVQNHMACHLWPILSHISAIKHNRNHLTSFDTTPKMRQGDPGFAVSECDTPLLAPSRLANSLCSRKKNHWLVVLSEQSM